MTTRATAWPPGTPCWADLSVPDVDTAKAFYGEVLGWHFTDSGSEYGGYVMADVGGHSVAGVGPQQSPGIPPAWTLYLASEAVDATAGAVEAAGGTVLMPAMDVGPMGRMIIAADPTGAVFGVWQAGEHHGAGLVNAPGGLTWEDLRSTDPSRAVDFYNQVFGYSTEAVEGAPDDYRMFALPGGEGMGGMGGMMGAPDGAPSHWLVYFGVLDVEAAVTAAEAHGGTALAPAFDTPYGRMAALTDPAGAVFWVVGVPAPA